MEKDWKRVGRDLLVALAWLPLTDIACFVRWLMVLENQRSATFSAKKLSKLFQRRNKYWIRICLVEFGDKKCARFSVRDEPATWNLARVRGKWLDPKKEKKHKKATQKMASYNVTILDMFFLWRGLMSKLWRYVKLGLTWKRHAIRPSSFRNEARRCDDCRMTLTPTQARCFLNCGLKTFVDVFVATDLLESCWISLKSVHLDLHCERSWYTRSNLWIWGCFILSHVFSLHLHRVFAQIDETNYAEITAKAKRRKVCRVVSSFQ